MCNSAASVRTQERSWWSIEHDDHSRLISENGLRETVARRQALVKLEGRLLRLPAEDPDNWEVIIDRESQGTQDLPAWWEDDPETYLSQERQERVAWWQAKFSETDDGLLICAGSLLPVGWGKGVLSALVSIGGAAYLEGYSGDLSALQTVNGKPCRAPGE